MPRAGPGSGLRSGLALAGVAAALAGALFWTWQRARSAPQAEPELVLAADPRDGAGDAPRSAGPEPDASAPSLSLPDPGPKPEPARPAGAPAAGGAPLDGRVLAEREDGTPVGGARVYWFAQAPNAGVAWLADLDDLGLSLEFLELHGRRFAADEHGLAAVPVDGGFVQIAAATDDAFGMTTCARGTAAGEPVRVRLRACHGVDVVVRGAASRAALAGVLVIASSSPHPESKVGAHTDAQGRARLWPLFHEAFPRAPWYASVPGIFRADPRRPLAGADRSVPLEILLPDSAPALVRLVDERGMPVAAAGKLTVEWDLASGPGAEAEPDDPRAARELPHPMEQESRDVALRGGEARLHEVEAGLALRLRARLDDAGRAPVTAEVAVDAAARETVRFELRALPSQAAPRPGSDPEERR